VRSQSLVDASDEVAGDLLLFDNQVVEFLRIKLAEVELFFAPCVVGRQ